jgi:hypothetical protein
LPTTPAVRAAGFLFVRKPRIQQTPTPPTIAHLKVHGLDGLFVTCANAARQRSTPFTFAAGMIFVS